MKCKECREYNLCLHEANVHDQIFNPEYDGALCFEPLTNADHIRAMSDEELGKAFANFLRNTFKLNKIKAELEDTFEVDMID